jgi:tetratricopeptide (TPR) repeat protein
LLEEAFRLSEEGRVLAAIQTCQQAVAINPNSTSAHSLLGTLYERQGDRDNAIRSYEQVLTLSPGSTVERRRLNELMGVPAAREAAGGISPRTARIAVTSFATVVALVLVGAIVMTLQQPSRPQPAGGARATTAVPQAYQETVAPAQASGYIPTPGSQYFSAAPRFNMPRLAQPRAFGTQPRQNVQRYGGQGGGAQWVAPGTYMIPATAGQRSAGPRRVAQMPAAPFMGAVPVYGAATPTMTSPAPGQSYGARISADTGRNYYFQGDYQRSIDAYQVYLSQNPTPAAREELAWVYTEAGNHSQATQQYQRALNEYQTDLGRSHNMEAARHGVRTCESALRALQPE